MSNRTCDVDGCVKPHRARGLCSTHYNKQIPKDIRHPRIAVPCTVCGAMVSRTDPLRYRPTCSVECRRVVTYGTGAPANGYDWAVDAAGRAVKRGADVVEVFRREDIFERDDYTCQECGITCTEPDPFVLTSATIDHVVPYAKNGEHSRVNAQTLCLSCNSRKADRLSAAS